MLNDITRRQHHFGARLLKLVCLVVRSIVHADIVSRVDQILDNATAHDAQADEAELLGRCFDVLRLECVGDGGDIEFLCFRLEADVGTINDSASGARTWNRRQIIGFAGEILRDIVVVVVGMVGAIWNGTGGVRATAFLGRRLFTVLREFWCGGGLCCFLLLKE